MKVARAAPSRRIVFGIVAMALFMWTVDATIVSTALPAIQRNLRATINWAGWTITIYSLGSIVALPVAGKISDQFGRRRIFLYGVTLFTLSSLACGFATDIYVLIAFRALQAIGGGVLTPSAAGIIADHFGNDRDRAIGMFGTFGAAGQIVGPVLGGLLVGYLSWRWIFFVNVPVGVLLFLAVLRYIPDSPPRARTRTDVEGLVLMVAFILSAIFAITSLGNRQTEVSDPVFLLPAVCAAVTFYLFVRHANRVPDPFIPVRLLRGRGFAVMNLQNTLWGAAGFGVMSLAPLYAHDRYHLPALSSGTLLTARAVGAIAVSALAVLALRRTGYRLPMIVGFCVTASGMLVMSMAPRFGFGPYLWLSIGASFTGVGNGMANPASRNAGLQLAPDDVAVITGLRNMFNSTGVIFSVAIATAVLNRSSNPGIVQAHILWVAAGVLVLVMLPLVFRVPEGKGHW